MKKSILISFLALCILSCRSITSNTKEYTLVENGIPKAAIILPAKPTKSAQLAAFELREHVKLITGTELPILSEKNIGKSTNIYLGNTLASHKASLAASQFSDQEYAIQPVEGGIILTGKDKNDTGVVTYKEVPGNGNNKVYAYHTWPSFWDARATLHATYEFLQDACGIRWFDPTDFGTDYQKTKTLRVKVAPVRKKPAFKHRDFFAGYGCSEFYDNYTSLWHKKSNGFSKWEKYAYSKTRKQFPSETTYRNCAKRGLIRAFLYRHMVGGEKYRCNHSFYGYYPRFWEKDPRRATFFKGKKASWFAQGYNKLQKPPQMCYSNKEFITQVVKDAENWFAGHPISPNSGMPITKRSAEWCPGYFPVVPMDNRSWCKCKSCQKMLIEPTRKDQFSCATASNYIWPFVNEVARKLKKTYPDKYIASLAYGAYALPPSSIKLEDNISVQLCLGIRAVYDQKLQATDDEMLTMWSSSGKRPIFLWLYYCFPSEFCNRSKNPNTWHCFPGFFAQSIFKAFRKYKEHNVRGMFFNGIGQEVENYVTLKALQDPFQDLDVLLNEYFTRMYGPAGIYISALYKKIEAIYTDPQNHFTTGEEDSWEFQGTLARMAEMASLMKHAEKVIKNASEIQQKRLNLFKLAVWDYMVKGKEKHKQKLKTQKINTLCPYVKKLSPDNLKKLKWERDAQYLGGIWKHNTLDGSRRKIQILMMHDCDHLFIKIREIGLPSAPTGDSWRFLFANSECKTIQDLVINSDGTVKSNCFTPQTVNTSISYSNGIQDVYAAIPLSNLSHLITNNLLLFNCKKISATGKDSPVLSPTGGNIKDILKYARITIGKPQTHLPQKPCSKKGLILKWNFNGTDSIITDQSPMGNNGILSKTKIRCSSKRFGNAVDLTPGYPDERCYIDLKEPEGFNNLSALTISAWVKLTPHYSYNRPAEYYALFVADNGLSIDIRPEGRIFFKDSKKSFEVFAPVRTLTPAAWSHLVLSCGKDKVSIYINGKLAKSIPHHLSLQATTKRIRIGQLLNPLNHFQFTGKLGKLEVFNRKLSSGEVADLFNKEETKVFK